MSTRHHEPTSLWQAALDFVFPALCPGCGKYLGGSGEICESCRERVETYDEPFCLGCDGPMPEWPECPACGDKALALFAYGDYADPLRSIIHEFKFGGLTRAIRPLVIDMVRTFEDSILACLADYLVPIPLHPSREQQRGYNQAEILARDLAVYLDIPVDTELLVRKTKRKLQQKLPYASRERNIRDVFTVTEREGGEQAVILVDDVVTSGATMREAARVLTAAGYSVPAVIALAHGR